jgi:hypothetical protein
LRPVTVTELPPLGAQLRAAPEPTAASKLNTGADVPTTPPTLTADSPTIVLIIKLLRQESDVADVQDDVPQATIPSMPLALGSAAEKLSPVIVTELAPLGTPFAAPHDATAASKLKPRLAVLVKTLTHASRPTPPARTGAGAAQTSCVVVVHAVVAHGWPATYPEGLRSLHWKLTPRTVIVAARETCVFRGEKEEMLALERNVGYAVRSVVPHAK